MGGSDDAAVGAVVVAAVTHATDARSQLRGIVAVAAAGCQSCWWWNCCLSAGHAAGSSSWM